jgi:hypothetical protein
MSEAQNPGSSPGQAPGAHRPQPVPVTLSNPIKAHGRDVSELTLRPLTGKDLRICGAPFKVGMRGQEGILDTQAVSSLICELAGVPISSVDQLAGVDWFTCWSVIQGFLDTMNMVAPSMAMQSSRLFRLRRVLGKHRTRDVSHVARATALPAARGAHPQRSEAGLTVWRTQLSRSSSARSIVRRRRWRR